jgi:hypothetical protein
MSEQKVAELKKEYILACADGKDESGTRVAFGEWQKIRHKIDFNSVYRFARICHRMFECLSNV